VAARHIRRETVPVPELGDGAVAIIRGMTGTERDAYEASLIKQQGRRSTVDMLDLRAKLVARCLVDEQDQRVFSDEEIGELGKMRADVLDRLYTVARRLSALSQEDIDELGKASS
jgi:hypothetical protein